jgi:pyrroloquinoline quinone biosynthesis protein B
MYSILSFRFFSIAGLFLCTLLLTPSCTQPIKYTNNLISSEVPVEQVSLVILGTLQDAGAPHIACNRSCCMDLFRKPDPLRKVVSLGLLDPETNSSFLIEATPDIASQVRALKSLSGSQSEFPDGIFLTHAHIGHYSGLMFLGKEAVNAPGVPVFVMPRMETFLSSNGPWSQLVTNENILLQRIIQDSAVTLTPKLKVKPFRVPHRDEYSETVGYLIEGPSKKALFIPDIDKWEKWDRSVIDLIADVDYAFIDATFFDAEEIGYRDISEIPHPFVIESMMLFNSLSAAEKEKIYFIHFNHTNPLLDPQSPATRQVLEQGFNIARIHHVIKL